MISGQGNAEPNCPTGAGQRIKNAEQLRCRWRDGDDPLDEVQMMLFITIATLAASRKQRAIRRRFLRRSDRDATSSSNSDPAETWSYASDAVLEERVYYLHDWHQDLVQLIGDDGAAVERVHYSAYGIPFGLHPADLDLDGDVDGSDFSKSFRLSALHHSHWLE